MPATVVRPEQVWQYLARHVDVERRRRRLTRARLAVEAEISEASLRRLLAGDPIQMHVLRRVTDALDLHWGSVVTAMADATDERIPTTRRGT